MQWIAIILLLAITGCIAPPRSESEVFDNVVQLTSGFSSAGEAQFSPDMNWIIFQAIPANESQHQLYIARLLRGGERITGIGHPIRVTPNESDNRSGHFSPDGLSVIFASRMPKGEPPATKKPSAWLFPKGFEIFRADGWEGAIAAAEFSRGINLANHPLTQNGAYDAEGSFARDGKWIVFTSTRDRDPTKPTAESRDADLYAMKPDGTDVVRLTTADGYDGSAAVSPDGRRIVFRTDRHLDHVTQISIADIVRNDRSEVTGLAHERAVTTDRTTHFSPDWHADGLHIVYAALGPDGRNYDLFLIRTDGTKKVRLTFHDAVDLFPTFSSNGAYLMWTSQRPADGTSQIYIGKFKMPRAG
jgi:Tol biopolymer transport system component